MPTSARLRFTKTSPAHTPATRYTVHLDDTLVGAVERDLNGGWHTKPARPAEAAPDDGRPHHKRRDATVALLAQSGLPEGVAYSILVDDVSEDEEPWVAQFLASLASSPA